MKKLFSVLLCFLIIMSVVSCNNTSDTKDTTSIQTNTNTPSQESDPYTAIIEKYKELLICKNNNTAIPEASETDSAAIKTVYELAKKCRKPLDMGYTQKDINSDGTNELIFTESTLSIVAIFTVKNSEVVPLITQEHINSLIWLDENGFVRVIELIMEGQYMTGRNYLVYEISEGNLKERIAIGCDAMEQGDWHKIEDNQKISVSKEENKKYGELAYELVKDAETFGSRLPGSEGERKYADFMGKKLEEIGKFDDLILRQ